MRIAHYLLLCVCGEIAWAQNLELQPAEIVLQMTTGGPLSPTASLQVNSGQAWTATVSNPDIVTIRPAAGDASARVSVTPTAWWALTQPAGTHAVTITVRAGEAVKTVNVQLELVEGNVSWFTYPSGPNGCESVAGLLADNYALCTVEDERPAGNFDPPARGGSYIDPNFGGEVRIIGGRGSVHGYSSPSPVSASGRLVLLANADEAPSVVRVEDGGVVYSGLPIPFEGTMWDAVDDRFLYFPRGATVVRYNLETRERETVADFSAQFTRITTGATGELSKDNWIAFHAPAERQTCAADLMAQPVTAYCAETSQSVDFVTMAKGIDRTTGKRYVVQIGNGPLLLFSVNAFENRLDLVTRGPENVWMDGGNRNGICEAGEYCIGGSHADTYEDFEGNQQLMVGLESQSPCNFGLFTLHLGMEGKMGLSAANGGGMRRILPLFRCSSSDKWLDFHIGCAKNSAHCAVSITSELFNQVRSPEDRSALRRTPYLGEIMVVSDGEVRRLAMHRSLRFSNEDGRGYWSTPRAAIAPAGDWVVATSNFGIPNGHRVLSIQTGYGAVENVEAPEEQEP
jgi:hypothetical protein